MKHDKQQTPRSSTPKCSPIVYEQFRHWRAEHCPSKKPRDNERRKNEVHIRNRCDSKFQLQFKDETLEQANSVISWEGVGLFYSLSAQ